MFTAVYLCYSLASQPWLAPFTRSQLQLQLNKTSNRDTRALCLSLTPSSENDLFYGRKVENQEAENAPDDSLHPRPVSYQFSICISSIHHCGGSIHLTSSFPPTHPPGPHILTKKATLRVLLLLSLPRVCFSRKMLLFMSRKPAAVCEPKVVVSGLGWDHVRLKNIELFVFFPLWPWNSGRKHTHTHIHIHTFLNLHACVNTHTRIVGSEVCWWPTHNWLADQFKFSSTFYYGT